ncbi:hypothetical protein ABT039_22220 [Streptomyces lasiicapitis]|uniref:hypothetical protein n=1 Tax=Streptomyces lasiicapitis TaxID=1923961 RepID=UPI00331CC57D
MLSKLTLVELSDLPRKPHGCPPEVERSWARLVATYRSVSGLFTTLNELRAAQSDMRGAISESHRDQARSAIVFTAAGIDACLRTLLRDSLSTLLRTGGPAHGAFTRHFIDNRLKTAPSEATKRAVVALDPRGALIDLYVNDLTGSSIQCAGDLEDCRDALGLKKDPALTDAILASHEPFFIARQQVVHELDLVDPSGKGTRGRRHRDIAEVGAQCDGALRLVHAFIAPTARTVKKAQQSLLMGWTAT